MRASPLRYASAARAPADASVARSFQAAAKIWDMASDEASVDHPLCRECAAALRKELEKQARAQP